jgi:acylpyruvate hydrolase
MRLGTIRRDGDTVAVVVEGDSATVLTASDVADVLAHGLGELDSLRTTQTLPLSAVDFAPLVPNPGATWCVGLNYAGHAEETGVPLPDYPTVFSKMASALIGAHDDIRFPLATVSDQMDWEAELVVVIGSSIRYADEAQAEAAIAGYTVGNDISVRDWQLRTTQWLLGKTLESSSPVGPWLVTKDEFGPLEGKSITCEVDGKIVQESDTGDLHFKPATLISYISQMTTLNPGDLIFTGTPSGVALSREGQPWLTPGAVVRTHIDGIGDLVNACVRA